MLLLLATLLVAGGGLCANAPTLDIDKAARVKAAYLLNFIRYSQWPSEAFPAPDSAIILTIVGDCPGSAAMAEVIHRAEPVEGRAIQLQLAPYAHDDVNRQEFYRSLDESHLVYICQSGPEPLKAILEHLASANVLTVGDTPGFVQSGGMIGFVLEENRIVFEASPKAIQKTRVTISAKVLKLAKIVDSGSEQ